MESQSCYVVDIKEVGTARRNPSRDQIICRRSSFLPRRRTWDDFAQSCGASYRGSHAFIWPKQFSHRLHVFEFYLENQKIAQCAVTQTYRRNNFQFHDSLQIRDPWQGLWVHIMQLMFEALGSGDYRYGSGWSLEPARDVLFHAIPGVIINRTEGLHVQAIDLAVWSEKLLSTNVRRNVAKAIKADPTISLRTSKKLPRWPEIFRMCAMRKESFKHKGVTEPTSSWAIQMLRRVFLLRQYASTTWVVFRDEPTAYAFNLHYGENIYYVDGSSIKDNNGSSWFLLVSLIKDAQKTNPNGRFVMGFAPFDPTHPATNSPGVVRQRAQCAVEDIPNSIVYFTYINTNRNIPGAAYESV